MVEVKSFFTYANVKREVMAQGLRLVESENLFTEGVEQIEVPKGLRLQIGRATYLVVNEQLELRQDQMLMYNGNNIFPISDKKFIDYLEGKTIVQKHY